MTDWSRYTVQGGHLPAEALQHKPYSPQPADPRPNPWTARQRPGFQRAANHFASKNHAAAPRPLNVRMPLNLKPVSPVRTAAQGMRLQVPRARTAIQSVRLPAPANVLSNFSGPQKASAALATATAVGTAAYNLGQGQGPAQATARALADPFSSAAGMISEGLLNAPAGLASTSAALMRGRSAADAVQAGRRFDNSLGGDAVAGRINDFFGNIGSGIDSFFGWSRAPHRQSRETPDPSYGTEPDFWGEAGKRYDVTYEPSRKYGEDSSQGETDWIPLGPRTERGVTGPIGKTRYSDPDNVTGKHKFIGVTSPDGARQSFEEFRTRHIVFGTGTSNTDVIDVRLEIIDVVEVSNGKSASKKPNPYVPQPAPRTPGYGESQSSPEPSTSTPSPASLALPAAAAIGIGAAAGLGGPGPAKPSTPAGGPGGKPSTPSLPRPANKPSAAPGNGGGGQPNLPPGKKGDKCGCNKGILDGVKKLFANNATDAAQLGLLAKIDATTTANSAGIAVNNAQGVTILTRLQQAQQFAEKAWQNTHLDKLINLMTLVTVLHNGAMISRDIGETLGYVVSNALAAVGVKDEDGNALDINGLVGGSVTNFIKSVVGEDVYEDTRTSWQKANRVLQAGSNIVWTLRNINDATQDVLEWTAENTGKIGNALKKYGVVGDRAYPWMSERVKAQEFYRTKFSRVFQGLESAEDTASSLAVVTSNVREIQQEVDELGEARSRFTDAVTAFGPEDTPGLDEDNQLPTSAPENQPIQVAEDAAAGVSQSPDVAISTDAQRGDPPDDATP